MNEINEPPMSEEPEDTIDLDTLISVRFVTRRLSAGFIAYIVIFLVLENSQYFHDAVKLFGAIFLLLAYFVILIYKKWAGGDFRKSIVRRNDLGLALTFLSLGYFILGGFVRLAVTDVVQYIFGAFNG